MENFVIAINETAMINCIYLKHFLFERYIVKNIHYTKNNEKYFVRIEPSQKLSNNTMKKNYIIGSLMGTIQLQFCFGVFFFAK